MSESPNSGRMVRIGRKYTDSTEELSEVLQRVYEIGSLFSGDVSRYAPPPTMITAKALRLLADVMEEDVKNEVAQQYVSEPHQHENPKEDSNDVW